MNSFSKMIVLLLSALAGASVVACRDKPRPTPESAPRAETPAPPPPSALGTAGVGAATRSSPKGPKLTEAECQKVIDHVLDVTAKEALEEEATRMSAAEKTKHLAALRAELASDPELKKQAQSCDDEYTRSEYACMMAATSGEAIEKCNEAPN
ncbi:MAG TPA: hypothetical protein VLT33_05980 [Labilithrix sp.]|nr:hypothetical protein [Labilithrix sp.]